MRDVFVYSEERYVAGWEIEAMVTASGAVLVDAHDTDDHERWEQARLTIDESGTLDVKGRCSQPKYARVPIQVVDEATALWREATRQAQSPAKLRGAYVRRRRKWMSLTCGDLARAASVTVSCVSAVERGRGSIEDFATLHAALNEKAKAQCESWCAAMEGSR